MVTISYLILFPAQGFLWTTSLKLQPTIPCQRLKPNSKSKNCLYPMATHLFGWFLYSLVVQENKKSLNTRLMEKKIMIPFHKKLCSRCHTIPHAKVKINFLLILDFKKRSYWLYVSGMVRGRTLRWDGYPLHRCPFPTERKTYLLDKTRLEWFYWSWLS